MTESKKETLAIDLIEKGLDLAEENIKNIKTGFLTFKVENNFTEEEESYIIEKLRECSIYFAEIVEKNEIEQEFHKLGLIFNYFFDKTVEIFYKQYNGIDLNTVNFDLYEIFEQYEVDVPLNIQRILHNQLLKIVGLTRSLWDYMEESGYFEMKYSEWLSMFLYTACIIGLNFVQNLDFNNDSEISVFLNP